MAATGLFGGTFDPVHHGHLQCAAAALAETGIDHVVFILSARPPHKNTDVVCSFDHRLAMLKIALQPHARFLVSDLERERAHPSYTIDTWNLFRQHQPAPARQFFIIGCDAFLEVRSWYRWRNVLSQINFIIVVRPGYDTAELYTFLEQNGFSVDQGSRSAWCNRNGKNRIKLLTTETDDISSTEVRRRVRQNLRWKHLVPEKVGDYIIKHSLYS